MTTPIIVDNSMDIFIGLGIPLPKVLDEGFSFLEIGNWDKFIPVKFPSAYRANYFTIVLNLQGSITYQQHDKAWQLESGHILVCTPGQYRNFTLEDSQKIYLFFFTETFYKKFCNSRMYEEFPFLLLETFLPLKVHLKSIHQLEQIALNIKQEWEIDSNLKPTIIGNLLENLLFHIKEGFQEQYTTFFEDGKSSAIVQTFFKHVDTKVKDVINIKRQQPLFVKIFSDLQFLKEEYFVTIIKIKTGQEPVFWIHSKVIEELKTELKNSALSLNQIAVIFQFSTSRELRVFFKDQTGMTPTAYRKSLRTGQNL